MGVVYGAGAENKECWIKWGQNEVFIPDGPDPRIKRLDSKAFPSDPPVKENRLELEGQIEEYTVGDTISIHIRDDWVSFERNGKCQGKLKILYSKLDKIRVGIQYEYNSP